MANWPPKLATLAAITALGASLSFGASQPKTTSSKTSKSAHKSHKKFHKPRGQQAIDSERCHEIQAALIREHYLTGQPSGKWDDSTQAAMRRFQADQGWQNKSVPDSRALIRLGLGPDHEHLLNPETAMTTQPQLPARSAARSRTNAPATSQAGPQPAANMPGSSTAVSPVSAAPEVSPQQ